MTEKELAVAKANLRAWNHLGLIWRLQHKHHPPHPRVLRLIKIRALTYRRPYQEMVLSLGEPGGKLILDVGCGTSEYLEWLASDSTRVVGVDIAVEMLKLCREDIGKSNIDVVAADALHLPFRDEAFEMSTTFQALHHFPDWEKALTEMVRTSKKISLYEPNGDSILHRLMHLIRKTFRVEQRFKQTDEDYGSVEFQASGFSSTQTIEFLNRKGMNARARMFGMIPVSLLVMVSQLSLRLSYFVLAIEDLIRKIPIVRSQLGDMVVTGWKTSHRMKNTRA